MYALDNNLPRVAALMSSVKAIRQLWNFARQEHELVFISRNIS